MSTYQLKKIPEEINKIITDEQALRFSEKKILISKENIIYHIIKEWKKLKFGK